MTDWAIRMTLAISKAMQIAEPHSRLFISNTSIPAARWLINYARDCGKAIETTLHQQQATSTRVARASASSLKERFDGIQILLPPESCELEFEVDVGQQKLQMDKPSLPAIAWVIKFTLACAEAITLALQPPPFDSHAANLGIRGAEKIALLLTDQLLKLESYFPC